MRQRKTQITRSAVGLLVIVLVLSLVPATSTQVHAASPGDVLINEFVAKGTEWVELYNPSAGSVDITGWILSDGEDDEPLSGTIDAGGYFDFNTVLALSNDGDEIQLFDNSGNLIDEVTYGDHGGAPLPPFGSSTARSPDGADTGDFARDWNVDQTPTRGTINDAPGTALGSSIILNEQNAFSPGGDFYELYNPTAAAVDLTGWQVSDGDDIRDVEGVIPPGGFLEFDNLSISSVDVMYLWDANGVRIDQLGRAGEFEDGSLQRIPDGIGPNDGYDFESSGGGETYFDCTATPGAPNGTEGCSDGAPISLTVPEIQGDGQWSPFEGELADTSGVVTLISANGRDMWIQDPIGDGDPATSDGIFVDDRDRLVPRPEVGDVIRLTATVEELQFGTQLPLTRLNNPVPDSVQILSRGNPLPDLVNLTNLPKEFIPEGESFWEPLEGMLVVVENAPVVAPTNRFGEFAMVAKTDAKPGSGFFPQAQHILLRELDQDPNVIDYNPERIFVDDASIDDPIVVMPGDRMRSFVGVVDYTFGMYKLQPASFDVFTHKLPKLPASKRSGSKGDTVITTYNVENLFDLVDNPDKDDGGSTPAPEELEIQLTKLAMAFQVELELPEIVVVQEVENTEVLTGDTNGYVPGSDSILALLPRLPGSWDAVSFETSDGRGIEVAFIWNTDQVSLIDAYQMSGPGVEMWFGESSPSPGREPLVGVFSIDGSEITIIGNHFKSKGGDDPLYGVNWPPNRITEVQRKGQAGVVRSFVNEILNENLDELVMVTGDLNDFQFGEPGEGIDHPIAILEGVTGGVPLTNLLNLEKEAETFTFLFDGNSQVLDHTLVSPALFEHFVAVDILHFNAGFPSDLGNDPTTTLRASDHDPLESRFNLR